MIPVRKTHILTEIFNLPYLDLIWVEGGCDIVIKGIHITGKNSFLNARNKATIEGFYIMAHPVSQAFWEAVMGENPSMFRDLNRPVESISFDNITGINGFLPRLNANPIIVSNGIDFQLPGKLEWGYCAYPYYQDNVLYNEIDYNYSLFWSENNTRMESTEPLGSKLPNRLGLYDMFGQVWEFTNEELNQSHFSRGGSFQRNVPIFGTTQNDYIYTSNNLGFRLIAR
jgi:formylglycine-generating enzyme required for sulfatase activity